MSRPPVQNHLRFLGCYAPSLAGCHAGAVLFVTASNCDYITASAAPVSTPTERKPLPDFGRGGLVSPCAGKPVRQRLALLLVVYALQVRLLANQSQVVACHHP